MKKKNEKESKNGSKRTWKCKYGCDNNATPCKHLERIIDSNPKSSVNATPKANIDAFYYDSGAGYVLPKEIKDRTWELQFREKLVKAGLESVKVDILVLKFVYDMSLKDISKELVVNSPGTVLRLLNSSLAYLKRVRFGKR